ncbi:bifunctional folylpolyglutamate synthase/dihydrofolate synthase [Candidatus Palauibacter sp.]|uniref:bifunctional folylpolyglutamate synthase/dihydrofolate synthase n=1 Tax=Candidatus Palauibacter sp. TaxID=3101350 RepID=UPI003B51A0FB
MLTGDGDALAALFDRRPVTTIRWGLDRIEALLTELGRPERSFDALHIAGTNGKGSTARFAASMLEDGGARTGLYTSPHLANVRERFLIDGAWVEESALQSAASRVLGCRAAEACTYFEVATALAFTCFAECGVEVAVVETGLGGRLDATNVLRPAGTAITPIGLDHTEWLGETPEAIAREKGGILRRGVPACLGRIDPLPLATLERIARGVGSPVARLGREARVSEVEARRAFGGMRFQYVSEARPGGLQLATGLPGRHQADNAALALLLLDRSGYAPDARSVRRGVARARLAGRFEVRPLGHGRPGVVFDIAHNPAAIEALCGTLVEVSVARPLVTVVGMLADKDWKGALARLALDSDAMILTRSAIPAERRWDPSGAQAWLSRERAFEATVCRNVAEAVSRGLSLAGAGTLLVTGSAYTVGEARALPALAGVRQRGKETRDAVRSQTGTTDEGRTHPPRRA